MDKRNIITFGNAALIPKLTYMPCFVLAASLLDVVVDLSVCLIHLICQLDFSWKFESSSHLIILSPCTESNICKKQYVLTL